MLRLRLSGKRVISGRRTVGCLLVCIALLAAASCGAQQGTASPPRQKGRRIAPTKAKLVKLPFSFGGMKMENTPVIYRSRPLLVQNFRSTKVEEQDEAYLFIEDLVTGRRVARLGTGFSFVSAFVNGDELNVFGTVNTSKEWTKDVYRFWSTDLKTWKQELVITRDGDEHLFLVWVRTGVAGQPVSTARSGAVLR